MVTLGMTLGNRSGTDFGASQCIPMGPCRLTLGVFIPLILFFTELSVSLAQTQLIK